MARPDSSLSMSASLARDVWHTSKEGRCVTFHLLAGQCRRQKGRYQRVDVLNAWHHVVQIYFSHLPLQSTATWPLLLQRSREEYDAMRRKQLRAPDGSFSPEVGIESIRSSPTTPSDGGHTVKKGTDFSASSEAQGLNRANSVVKDLRVNNPLSLEESNPWRDHFATLDLRRTIVADVQRIFPEVPIFQDQYVQQALTNLILVWCLLHPDLGYRQGMHELAGSVWFVRQRDALKKAPTSRHVPSEDLDIRIQHVLDSEYVEHDTYAMFAAIMRNASSWYEWRDPAIVVEGQLPPPRPILIKCAEIQKMLATLDPALHAHLESLGIEPQLYVLRWVRLLFTREFELPVALDIWDALFAADSTLALVDFVVIAMLLRIRGLLLQGDYAQILQLLLRFPALEGEDHDAPSLLVRQAVRLRDQTRPTTAVDIVMENQQLLGIPVTIPEVPSEATGPAARRTSEAQTIASGRSFGQRSSLARGTQPYSSSGGFAAAYIPEGISDLARGLYERSDALGINRALESTMSNVQRTVGAYASVGLAGNSRGEVSQDFAALSRAAATVGRTGGHSLGQSRRDPGPIGFVRTSLPRSEPSSSASNSAMPSTASFDTMRQTPNTLHPLPPDSDLVSLQQTNRAMGSALDQIVSVFERQWTTCSDKSSTAPAADIERQANISRDSDDAIMSLCALKHIRDVLLGATSEYNPSIMGSEVQQVVKPLTSSSAIPGASTLIASDSLPSVHRPAFASSESEERVSEPITLSPSSTSFPTTGFARTRIRSPISRTMRQESMSDQLPNIHHAEQPSPAFTPSADVRNSMKDTYSIITIEQPTYGPVEQRALPSKSSPGRVPQQQSATFASSQQHQPSRSDSSHSDPLSPIDRRPGMPPLSADRSVRHAALSPPLHDPLGAL